MLVKIAKSPDDHPVLKQRTFFKEQKEAFANLKYDFSSSQSNDPK